MMETGEVRELAGRGDKWMRQGGGRGVGSGSVGSALGFGL